MLSRVLSVQLPVGYKGIGLYVQSPVTLRVLPRDPLQPDVLIYYVYIFFFLNAEKFSLIKIHQ